MVIMAHFIDDDWNLHKRVFNFCQVAHPDTIGKAIEKCLEGWGIDRLFIVTVDNASSNDVAIVYLVKKFKGRNGLVLDGTENLVSSSVTVELEFNLNLGCSFGFTKDQLVPMGSQIARVREHASSGVEVEVRAKASWRMTRRKMPPHRGAHRGGGRGGREAGRIQPEEQPIVQAANPTAPVTQADLAVMEQRHQDMLRAALALFHAA
ncbi:putative transposase [Cucumis melo var. makuwa]|uniref:Transposase n=1 Tax=Cucumis melo var. makuwa TaxID=1194695 RepID=A0A5A7UIZ6_CUCMM|nr:putative transposase [Cucumis melo var. makuwa]TYK22737.1 putative transposase [Cucumis melo var. makuwa]